MSTDTIIPAEVLYDLQRAADLAAKGVHDMDVMRQACEHMDRVREEIFEKQGILDIGLPAIREVRDS